MNRTLAIAIGIALAALGAFLALFPDVTADLLSQPDHQPPTARINLRASYGGTLLGLGMFLVWLPAAKPWKRTILGLLMWAMAGIGVARLVGFVVDGWPRVLARRTRGNGSG
ncbi:MAG: DUF4345 domain-containing protein [Deltaproteobacteria bacterium]|nr:DUF4345 domain-containing protein [Deltaproteobacteria bacterium]